MLEMGIEKHPFYHRSITMKDDCMQLSEKIEVSYSTGTNCKTYIEVTTYEQCEDLQLFVTDYSSGRDNHIFSSSEDQV